MSFTRIQNEARQAAERALDRYVALLQQERDWAPAEEAEMRGLMEALGKDLAAMAADRQVIALVRDLQRKVEVGQGLSEPRAAAWQAAQEYDNETRELIKERRIGYFKLSQVVSEFDERWSNAEQARHELVKLVKTHPLLLGNASGVAKGA